MYIEHHEAQALIQLIQAAQTIIIHRHVRPDPDAIGSQLGLKSLIESTFPDKRVLAAGTTTQGLKWIGAMDKVTAADYQDALVIVCDTANQPRIDGDHYDKGATLVKIDHHPQVDDYGQLQIVHPIASSTCEIIAEISRHLGDQLPMQDQAARLLYTGMVSDTARFLYESTTSRTLEVAAWLKQYDFSSFEISDRFMRLSFEEAKFQGHIFETMSINEAGVAWVTISQEDIKTFGISEEQTQIAVTLPGRIEGVLSWVIFVQQEGNSDHYRCRIRSKGPVINGIAANHDGGGHPMASGANAHSLAERQAIVEELTQAVLAYRQELEQEI